MEHTESQSLNWNFYSSPVSPFGKGFFDDVTFTDNGTDLLQPADTVPTCSASMIVPMPSFPDGVANTNPNELSQQINSSDNSQRDVEGGVVCTEPDPKHLDHAGQASNGRIHKDDEARMPPLGDANSQEGTSSRGCNEKKRKGPQLEEAEQAQKQKKREADKIYRANRKEEYEKLKKIQTDYENLLKRVTKCGGIDQIESVINHNNHINSELQKSIGTELGPLQQMESRYGGIDRMKFMLDKFKELEAKYGGIEKLESILEKFVDIEADSNKLNQIKSMLGINEAEFIVDKLKGMADDLHKLDQIKSLFGGIDETEPAINRIKKMELQLEKQKPMVSQKEVESFQASPGSPPEKSGSQPLDLIADFDNVPDNLNFFTTVSGTAPNMQYNDEDVDRLIARITDENIPSDLATNSVGDLLGGARERVNKYEIPSLLVSTAQHIFNDHGDITRKCKLSDLTVQTIFVLFCAAIKEMVDLSLENVNVEIIWKLRHPIMDAKRIEFDAEFAMKRLITIVHGYFGLKARQDRHKLERWVASLRADDETLRKGLEKKSQEIQDTEAKLRRLESHKCKICLESMEKFVAKDLKSVTLSLSPVASNET
ncbi:uncharacterized protein LOC108452321 [Gossypium arboreum]|uniref:uncharacterized protein LOC108452321 n=1 Tax=Gossypium arboreum TaxID=29729 RepID=UPI0008191277|nr:uncharacterized protein LOC108452321 [Gossypium arboreum]